MQFVPTILADTISNERISLARLGDFTEWWHWLLLIAVSIFVAAFIAFMYFVDSRELSWGMSILLLSLRIFAFVGLLLFFLDMEKRTEHEIIQNSRVLLLLDNSLSMDLRDEGSLLSRSEDLATHLSSGPLLTDLRTQHDVVAYTFSDEAKPAQVATFPKIKTAEELEAASQVDRLLAALKRARTIGLVAAVLFGVSLLAVLISLMMGTSDARPWVAAIGIWLLLAAGVTMAVGHLQAPELKITEIAGVTDATQSIVDADEESQKPEEEDPADKIDWRASLMPVGGKTRISDAVRYLANKERGGPVSGIVLFSDGGQNAGAAAEAAEKTAGDAKIPVYTVGLGSDKMPASMSVVDLQAPLRVYPSDEFSVVGLLRANGLAGRTVNVELFSTPESGGAATLEDTDAVELGPDGETVAVRFKLKNEDIGRWVYTLKAKPLDASKVDEHTERELQKDATVEVVEQRNKVLILAGGPTREFRFLRNQLYRDRDTELHVYLQSGAPGISQEADEILFDFPRVPDEIFQYDCIIGFDPDWRSLDEVQVKLLERWVAEKGGGLILVAGPVFTPLWTNKRRGEEVYDILKGMYPVVFYHAGAATMRLGRFGGSKSWPLDWTRAGRFSEFLWLEDDAQASEDAWDRFGGIYGYYAVREPKKGAQVYAHFSDPETSLDGQLPIYLAGHFYGAGRVFFQASGEMWRVRAVEDAYFEQYYTKLIRWASQGRLLRDSSRGVLLVNKTRAMLGEQITITAILQDEQHKPLDLSEVNASLMEPGAKSGKPIRMLAVKDGARGGTYTATFTAAIKGDYRIEMSPPGAADEVLTADVRVLTPDLEVETPQRNDALLMAMAEQTGGENYIGVLAASTEKSEETPLLKDTLESQEKRSFVPASSPDRKFDVVLRWWLLALVCVALCLEWTTRRLARLA